MNVHCVGYAGAYPFLHETISVRWQLMESHISSTLRTSRSVTSSFLEQDVLPTLPRERYEQPGMRLALCGVVWDGETAYGGSLSSLLALQSLLDCTFPACFDRFSGDFSLSYLPPDSSLVCLYRSITCTRCLYYRVTEPTITWSTNPADLFPSGQPTLADIDIEMVAILTATGQADPSRTCYQQVACVAPGDCLCWKPDRTRSHVHFDYVQREDHTHLPYTQAAKRLREQIEAAVTRSLYGFSSSNVLLSGGLDTSIVAYEIARRGGDLHGYHWTWPSGEGRLFHDEDQAAQEVADLLRIPLHTLDFGTSIANAGDYVRSMYGLVLPYNHAFYRCYAQTMATVHAVRGASNGHLLVGGHLGDALLQGDWADAFRPRRKSPWKHWHTLYDLLAWYPRGVALAAWWYILTQDQRDLEENPNRDRLEVHRSLMTPSFFERVLANGNRDYRQQYPLYRKNVGAQATRAGLQSSLDFSAHLEAAFLYRDAIPQEVVFRHPFSDRQLHEFCLSLGAHHRTRWYAGHIFSKFLLRLAYVGDLPPSVIKSERRTPYASVSEQFCFYNREELAEIFSPESYLVRFGILDAAVIQEILPDAILRQKHSRSFVRMAGVEMWLRGLAQEPLRHRECAVDLTNLLPNASDHAHLQHVQRSGLLTLREGVRAHCINTALILVNTSTLEVCRLDEEAVQYWQAFCLEPTWSCVFTRLHHVYPQDDPDEIKAHARRFADILREQGWAVIQKKEEEERDVCANNTHHI